jgi:putative Ca2+/H+ antiporter (TMEM165/GDT1 family)
VSLAGNGTEIVGVWLGSTLGMILADALAIGVGIAVGKRLPHRVIGWGAATLFVVFGIIAIGRGLTSS